MTFWPHTMEFNKKFVLNLYINLRKLENPLSAFNLSIFQSRLDTFERFIRYYKINIYIL